MTNINFDLLEKTPIAVELTSQGKILYVNQKYLEIHGYTEKSEVIGRHVMEFQPEEIRLEQQQIGSSREKGEDDVPYIYTSKGLQSDGSIFPIRIHAYRVMYNNNPSILSYIEDMSSEINREELEAELNKKFADKLNKNKEKIKRYKELLAQENKKYRTLFDLSPIGVIGHQDQKIKFVNPALVEMLGYDSQDELLDQPIFYIISSEEHELVKSKVKSRQLEHPEVFETKLISKQDYEVPVIVSAEIIDVPDGHELHFVYLMDISERKALQEEKDKLQNRVKLEDRMNVVGHLAGGIAHDFNNLLSVILGNAELLKMFYSDDRGANLIDEIMKTTNRAAELTKKLLTISKDKTTEFKTLQLKPILFDVISMGNRTFPKTITIKYNFAEKLIYIRGDENQLLNAILNIFINAKDAMDVHGTISITTSEIYNSTNSDTTVSDQIDQSKYVKISIKDTGNGMDEETLNKIFDPFYTTKEKGTGLGLSRVYATIRNHQGWIDVDSTPNRGSTFMIYLPIVNPQQPDEIDLQESNLVKKHYSCLLIEDEESIRELLTSFLIKENCSVTASGDPVGALEHYETNFDNIDVVLMDINMPGMNGWELLKQLTLINPELTNIIILTGSIDLSDKKLQKYENHISDILYKPFKRDELIRSISTVLQRD